MNDEFTVIEFVNSGEGGRGALAGEVLSAFGSWKVLAAEDFQSGENDEFLLRSDEALRETTFGEGEV